MRPVPLLADERDLRRRYPFASLVRPGTGIITGVQAYAVERGGAHFELGATGLGNLTMTFPHVTTSRGTDVRDEALGGASADVDREQAWIKAAVEGIERYATSVWSDREFRVATAAELGDDAIDLDRLPQLSARELADPRCLLRRPDKRAPMRWTKGWSLVDGRPRWVPAALVHLYFTPWESERFTSQITTGVAAHTSLATALVSGLDEVIERDAIALTWLARLPLPRIVLDDHVPASLAPALERFRASLIPQYFFDATTDLGIPTVFSVQVSPGHARCELVVSAATAFDVGSAVAKCLREAASCRTVMQGDLPLPEAIEDFADLRHGAVYYARGGHLADFDFLLDAPARTTLAAMQAAAPVAPDAGAQLAYQVARLRELGMDAVALDLTTDEVRDAGLWVVRVVVPDLMPLGFMHRCRFLASPRLYSYPRRFGIELAETGVNPNPLPFA